MENPINMSNIMYDALKSQFVAQKQKALATLSVYLTNPVGIGEHPQHIDEMMELTRSLAEAIDCIEVLEETFEINDIGDRDDRDGGA